jgi:hypothetical protein
VANLAARLHKKSTDAAFKTWFREASARTAKEGFYVCEMIEHYLGSQAGMLPNPQSPTQHLEHIFPRRPDRSWPQMTDDEIDLIVNRYGNLLVLEANINRHIKNKDYAFKKSNPQSKDYSNSRLILPQGVINFEDAGQWTKQSIEDRQSFLADAYAVKVWSLAP